MQQSEFFAPFGFDQSPRLFIRGFVKVFSTQTFEIEIAQIQGTETAIGWIHIVQSFE